MYFVHDHVSPVIESSVERIIHLIRVRFVFDSHLMERIIHLIRVRIAFDPYTITMYQWHANRTSLVESRLASGSRSISDLWQLVPSSGTCNSNKFSPTRASRCMV